MAVIKYKNTEGDWTQLSASDIGAASYDIIARGQGQPVITDTNTNIKNDTLLYIDQNDYDGERSTITKLNTDAITLPLPINQGGTGVETLAALKELVQHSNNELLNMIYPLGSIYMSAVNTSPADLFGFGSWSKIEGRFLVGIQDGDSDFGNSDINHGVRKVTLTAEQSGVAAHTHTPGTYKGPSHTHTPGTYKGPSHTHTPGTYKILNHNHELPNSAIVYNTHRSKTASSMSGSGNFGTGTDVKSGYKDNTYGSGNLAVTGTSGSAGNIAITGNSGSAGNDAIVGNSGSATPTPATQPHNNLPPYLPVYMWKRIA